MHGITVGRRSCGYKVMSIYTAPSKSESTSTVAWSMYLERTWVCCLFLNGHLKVLVENGWKVSSSIFINNMTRTNDCSDFWQENRKGLQSKRNPQLNNPNRTNAIWTEGVFDPNFAFVPWRKVCERGGGRDCMQSCWLFKRKRSLVGRFLVLFHTYKSLKQNQIRLPLFTLDF